MNHMGLGFFWFSVHEPIRSLEILSWLISDKVTIADYSSVYIGIPSLNQKKNLI